LSSVNISISALNDFSKIQVLLSQLSEFIFNINKHFKKIDERYTNNLIISFKESYQNVKYLNPIEFASCMIKSTIIKSEYCYSELLDEINNITYTDIETHINSLLDGTSLTTLTYGNIQVKNVSNLYSHFSKLFYNPLHPLVQVKQVENSIIPHPNPNEKSHFVSYFYHVGQFTPRDYALMLLLIKILGEKFFDNLRTKNQLGYIVQLSLAIYRDSYYITEKIQSSKPIDFVKNKIDDFNSQIEKLINDSYFEQFVETINKELDEPDYSLEDKLSRYRPEISTRKYMFNRNQLIKEQLNKLTKQDLLNFSRKVLNESNRRTFIVQGN